MLPFALEPTETLVAPHGMIVSGAEATALGEMVLDRPRRFAGLHLATGNNWAILFGSTKSPPETLPYLTTSPRYLHRLAEDLFCEFGLQPSLPSLLIPRMGSYLRRTAGVIGPIALTGEDEAGRLYDLGQALVLDAISPPQPDPETPRTENPAP